MTPTPACRGSGEAVPSLKDGNEVVWGWRAGKVKLLQRQD